MVQYHRLQRFHTLFDDKIFLASDRGPSFSVQQTDQSSLTQEYYESNGRHQRALASIDEPHVTDPRQN
jgi:hypothetical protein